MNIKSVMTIDDSEADQLLMKMLIKEYDIGIEILQAYDGKEALEILADQPKQPDVIFLDINMPGMNGHDFLKEYTIREDQTTVVIMLTSSDQEQDKQKAMSYECVKKYSLKPIEHSDLEELFESELK